MPTRTIHKCVTCRHFEGRPHYPPPSPPLPAFRVKKAPAFTHTGVDYAGPLFIKSDNAFKESKAWICLYTCYIVRVIHLEVVPDLTAQQARLNRPGQSGLDQNRRQPYLYPAGFIAVA